MLSGIGHRGISIQDTSDSWVARQQGYSELPSDSHACFEVGLYSVFGLFLSFKKETTQQTNARNLAQQSKVGRMDRGIIARYQLGS